MIAKVRGLGFQVEPFGTWTSVRVEGRQVAFFREAGGEFVSGWVETEKGTGRTDFRGDGAEWLSTLERRFGGA